MAFGKQTLVQRLRGSAHYINRISGAILVVAGLFIVWFWGTEIASGATALGGSPAFQVVENLSQTALNFVADHTLLVAGSLGAALVGAAGLAIRQKNHPPASDDDDGGSTSEELIGATGRSS
jgi:hypothetical protein